MTRSVRRAESVLAGLDPAADLEGDLRGGSDQRTVLNTILAASRDEPRRAAVRPRRRLFLAGAALALAAAATTGAVAVLRHDPAPAYAATAPPLRYERPTGGPTAAELLRGLADTAERSPTKGSGGYGYIHTKQWQLANPNLAPKGVYLTVDPSETWLWYQDSDRSTRIVQDSPQFGRHETRQPAGTQVGYVCWTTSVVPQSCPTDKLMDPKLLRDVLFISGQGKMVNMTGEQSPLGGYAHLAGGLVLPPGVRAQVLRVLADLPGIAYTGRARDRAGRTGEAFSLDFDAMTGPVRDTIIVDPATGTLLGYERTLLSLTNPNYFDQMVPGAVPLKVRTPAVVDYTVLLEWELRATDR